MRFVGFVRAVVQGAMVTGIGLVVLLGIGFLVRPDLLTAYLLASDASRVVVAASRSPDGALEARLLETNGGATTSFGYVVELRRNNATSAWHEVANLYAATRSACAYGVNVRWSGPRSLTIQYLDARRTSVAGQTDIDGEPVTIEMRRGIDDPAAPCGGMEASFGR